VHAAKEAETISRSRGRSCRFIPEASSNQKCTCQTGFLNTLEHKALQSEIVSTRVASVEDSSDDEPARHSRHSSGGSRHYYHGSGGGGRGPGAFFGHMMGGLFR
jgi:hypothetical protein